MLKLQEKKRGFIKLRNPDDKQTTRKQEVTLKVTIKHT